MDKTEGHEIDVQAEKGPNGETIGVCRKCGARAAWDDGIGANEDGTPYEPKPGEEPEWNEGHPAYVASPP